jgi:uncharacterized membrane protein YphA (DoxX/SURF4 family)
MNGFKRICAVILGSVLFIAGALKLMDPVGSQLIVQEYLKFFHLNFLSFAAGVSAIAFAFFEAVLGAALIAGVWRKVVAIISLALLGVFTIITAILWMVGPVMDCGCFGEALHLEHWQSFVKNIILLGLWAIAFLPLNKLDKPQKIKYVSFGIAAISLALFSLFSLLSIPIVDFTELKSGTELYGAFDENFDDITAAIYEKDGREGAFTPDCPPDSTWTFVRHESYSRNIIDDNASVKILSFCDAAGVYADSLALKGQVMVISSYNPDKLSEKRLEAMGQFASMASQTGYTVLFLVAGTPETVDINEPSLAAGTYFADRTSLMTLNRSNGGVTYISDGLITAKWSAGALPDGEELGKILNKDSVEFMMSRTGKGKIRLQGFLLYTFAVMLLL